MYLYKITNQLNGKLYIGQTTRCPKRRFAEHGFLSHSRHSILNKAMVKYGKENFKLEILGELSSLEDLNMWETHFIQELNTLAPAGYNLDSGGNNKIIHEDSKKKMSLAKKGRKLSKETIEKREMSRRVLRSNYKPIIAVSVDAKHSWFFSSAMEAEKFGFSFSCISWALKSKSGIHKGYIWSRYNG